MTANDATGPQNNALATEQSVVAKVTELMETLDHVRKYNTLARYLIKIVIAISVVLSIFLIFGAAIEFSGSNFSFRQNSQSFCLLGSYLWV
jgi:predicted nucleic acid-binding Zn ribbon protein